MWWITAQGDLFLGKPNYTQQPTFDFTSYHWDSTESRLNNVLSARVHRSLSERYSEIVVSGYTGNVTGKILKHELEAALCLVC